MEDLKPCPFCGVAATIGISDHEGNIRDEAYEEDPWSGLSYYIKHVYEENYECPIANHKEDGGGVGIVMYDSREDAISSWNRRKEKTS